MMDEVLQAYKDGLAGGGRLRPQTVRMYSERLKTLLEGQSIIKTLENLDVDKMISNLQNVKYKNEFSQYKNSLFYFLKSRDITLTTSQLEQIKALEAKTKKKYRRMNSAELTKMENTIRHLKNKKLKYSYQTLLHTGLRVSELAQITPNDCTLKEQELTFFFVGKGGKREHSTLKKENNEKLFENLKEMIKNTSPDHKLFYSANYLQQNAKSYGFECHDLRRAYAKVEYKKTNSKEDVKEKLRHANVKTTEKYLKSQVNIK